MKTNKKFKFTVSYEPITMVLSEDEARDMSWARDDMTTEELIEVMEQMVHNFLEEESRSITTEDGKWKREEV